MAIISIKISRFQIGYSWLKSYIKQILDYINRKIFLIDKIFVWNWHSFYGYSLLLYVNNVIMSLNLIF